MSVVCSICQDLITEDPTRVGGGNDPTNTPAVHALLCGHLFHQHCLTEWFRTRQQAQFAVGSRAPCPSCQAQSSLSQGVRVYLSLDDAQDESSGKSRKYLEKKVAELEKEVKKKTEDLKSKEEHNKRIIMKSAHESMELMDLFDDLKETFDLKGEHGEMSDVVEMIKAKYTSLVREVKGLRMQFNDDGSY